jgi:hypothetical protein
MSVKMTASKRTVYAGRKLLPDDKFEASNKDALVLEAIGAARPCVERAEEIVVATPAELEQAASEQQQRRRNYRSRDMTTDTEPDDGKPRRYRRRDMIAEGDEA